jgi:hypothetical protein
MVHGVPRDSVTLMIPKNVKVAYKPFFAQCINKATILPSHEKRCSAQFLGDLPRCPIVRAY